MIESSIVRKLSMRKISEVLRLRYAVDCSYRDISKSLSISISTVSDDLARARQAGVEWPLPEDMTDQKLYDKLFLPVDSSVKERTLPNMEWVHRELRKKGSTLLKIVLFL